MRSAVRKEHARNKDGQLTNWKTERRFVFIQFLQLTPLPKIMLNCRTEKWRRREKRAERNAQTVGYLIMRQQHQSLFIAVAKEAALRADARYRKGESMRHLGKSIDYLLIFVSERTNGDWSAYVTLCARARVCVCVCVCVCNMVIIW